MSDKQMNDKECTICQQFRNILTHCQQNPTG